MVWHLLIVIAPAWLTMWVLRRALWRFRRDTVASHELLSRAFSILALFFCEMLPAVALAAVGYLLLTVTAAGDSVRVIALVWINAAFALRVLLAASRMLTAPHTPEPRLIEADDADARTVDRRVRGFLCACVYSYLTTGADAA